MVAREEAKKLWKAYRVTPPNYNNTVANRIMIKIITLSIENLEYELGCVKKNV